MKLSSVKKALSQLHAVNFKLPDGSYVPSHFHVTEIGLVTKSFIDCGGEERRESRVNFQLWTALDFEHRLAPEKLLKIIHLSQKILGDADDLEIEVEYQQTTIGKFGLEFDGIDFILTAKTTHCLAQDACGITPNKLPTNYINICIPNTGCCP